MTSSPIPISVFPLLEKAVNIRDPQKIVAGLEEVLGFAEGGKEIDAEAFSRVYIQAASLLPAFSPAMAKLPTTNQLQLRQFRAGKSAAEVTSGGFDLPLEYPEYPDAVGMILDAKLGIKTNQNLLFQNWGRTIKHTPALTQIPNTVADIQTIVKAAETNKQIVRVSGFRHTWSDMYSMNGGRLISLLDIPLATGDSGGVAEEGANPVDREFNKIELLPESPSQRNGQKRWAKIGAGVTLERFRRWANGSGWTLPFNVIMVEITFGGANAPICHGAGLNHSTLSDLVREIYYIDAHGVSQHIAAAENPQWMKAAAGAFGLLGIVTHLVIELDKMTFAQLQPQKTDILHAIPPPLGYEIPPGVGSTITEPERQAAELSFQQQAQRYYSEWFWYPYNQQVWINCWDNNGDAKDSNGTFPPDAMVMTQWAESFAANVLNDSTMFKLLPGEVQGRINGFAAMLLQPPNTLLQPDKVVAPLIDALHFRRGIQNFRVRCAELNIPIPPGADDKPDWSIAQRAWWDAITVITNDQRKTGAMRVALEMRVMGTSNILMAPQSDNTYGTVSIEVVTNLAAADSSAWSGLVQQLFDRWTSYEDVTSTTTPKAKLNVRPHWAKEWENYKIQGVDIKQKLTGEAYKTKIPEFLDTLRDIGQAQGWTLDDIKARFSNPLLNSLFFPPTPPTAPAGNLA